MHNWCSLCKIGQEGHLAKESHPEKSLPVNAGLKRSHPVPRPIPNPKRPDGAPIPFSHPAEEAFARVLDFYEIEWEYEPTTFPLEWDRHGRVKTAFSPDFYLVADDAYIELTTMKQRLVTKKNRKLRLLKKLYPDVSCKLVYRKDVENMAVKYGLFEPAPDESGDDPEGDGQERQE